MEPIVFEVQLYIPILFFDEFQVSCQIAIRRPEYARIAGSRVPKAPILGGTQSFFCFFERFSIYSDFCQILDFRQMEIVDMAI